MSNWLHTDEILRRSFMSRAAKGFLGVSCAGMIHNRLAGSLALAAEGTPAGGKAQSVIYLYMNGAMSHLDTFDPKRAEAISRERPSRLRPKFPAWRSLTSSPL